MAHFTIEQLEKKYGMFLHPKYEVKLDEKPLEEEYLIEDMVVDIPYSCEAGSCSFKILNAFEGTGDYEIDLKDSIKQKIELGKKIEVSLGYETGKLVPIFKGYIDGIYIDFNQEETGVSYQIECLDAKGIMMNNLHSEQKKNVTKYSDAIRDIFKKYPKLIEKQIIDDTKEQTILIEQQKESDYDFISRIAGKLNYHFYLINGEAFFQKTNADLKEYFCFHIDEYMQEFHLYTTLSRQVAKVVVRSSNEQDPQQPFEAQAQDYSSNVDSSKIKAGKNVLLGSRAVKTIIDLSVTSQEEAKARAEAELMKLSCFQAKGSVVTVGIPELLPGKVVSIKGFGKAGDRAYRISRVIHRLTHQSYTTECELEGNKL